MLSKFFSRSLYLSLSVLGVAGCHSGSVLEPEDAVAVEEWRLEACPDGSCEVHTCPPVADTRLEEKAPDRTYGSWEYLWGAGASENVPGLLAGALMKFDCSGIPQDAKVNAASLRVYVTNGTTSRYDIFAMKRRWSEADLTWNQASAGVRWERAGAEGPTDRGSTVLGTLPSAATGAGKEVPFTTEGVAVVQGWVKTPASNLGVLLRPPLQAPEASTDALSFRSREVSGGPRLYVSYTPAASTAPDAGVDPGTGGTVRLMTMNVYHGKGTDEVYNPDRHAGIIVREQAEVVCVNEADGSFPADVARALAARTGKTWNRAVNSGTVDLILTPYRIVASDTITYSRSLCGTYGAVRATVDVGGKHVTVACTHLDVLWSDSCSGDFSASRAAQIRELKTWLSGVSGPKIVAGDLNTGYDASEMAAFGDSASGAYSNAWIEAVRSGLAAAYADNYVRPTTRTRKNDLDHILHTADLTVLGAKVPDVRDFTKPVSQVRKFLDANRKCPSYAAKDYAFPEDCFVRSSDHQPKWSTLKLP